MPIKVEVPNTLRNYTSGRRTVQAEGSDVKQLLVNLDARHPGLGTRLLTEDGGLRRFINIYVNDNDIRIDGALDCSLADGDVVTIIPAMAGGA